MLTFRALVVLPLAVLSLSSCVSSKPVQSSPMPDWKPTLDQPIGQLEELLATLEQQQTMNLTISNVASLYDAKLYLLFQDFLASLPESARASRIAEQRRWLKQRETQVNEAYRQYEGGSLASYAAGEASISATKKRIAEISSSLSEAPNMERQAPR